MRSPVHHSFNRNPPKEETCAGSKRWCLFDVSINAWSQLFHEALTLLTKPFLAIRA